MLVTQTCQRKAIKASSKEANTLGLTRREREKKKQKLMFLRSTTKNDSPIHELNKEPELHTSLAVPPPSTGSHRHGTL